LLSLLHMDLCMFQLTSQHSAMILDLEEIINIFLNLLLSFQDILASNQ
jgi:hypothetical protein